MVCHSNHKIPRRSPESKERIMFIRQLSKTVSLMDIHYITKIPYKTIWKYVHLTEDQVQKRVAGCRPNAGKRPLTSIFFDYCLVQVIKTLRFIGLPIHCSTISVLAKGLSKEFEFQNSPKLLYSESWAKKWIKRNKVVNRRISSSTKSVPDNWSDRGNDMIKCVKSIMNLYNISKELVLNADETPICLEPNINYSYDIKGKRDSPTVINFNLDKERISFLLTITSEGKHLKPYVVVKGKVVKRLVNDEVLKRCVVKANPKAWLTNELTKSYKGKMGYIVVGAL